MDWFRIVFGLVSDRFRIGFGLLWEFWFVFLVFCGCVGSVYCFCVVISCVRLC